MIDSYRIGNAGAVRRIGRPHEHDVLSGRGGAINSHIGNSRFREWIRERKNRYNLARTKAEKSIVANEVIILVRNQNPPGRFLQRDQSSVTGGVTWWVEVDEMKAMAKTSQALREGAPSIRAAHKDELTLKKRTRATKRGQPTSGKTSPSSGKRRSHQVMQQQPCLPSSESKIASTAAMAQFPLVALKMSPSEAMEELKANIEAARTILLDNTSPAYLAPNPLYTAPIVGPNTVVLSPAVQTERRSRLFENLELPSIHPQPHFVIPDDETPPLAPLPSPLPLSSIPELGDTFPMPAIPRKDTSLKRANSLALSDIGSYNECWGDVEFVNPFEVDASEEISSMPPISPFPFDSHYTNSGGRARNSLSNMSVKSELSDLCDVNAPSSFGLADSDFCEGMKDVYDAVHPGLVSAGENEPIPTHLYPYRGSYDLTQSSGGSPQIIY